MAPPTVPPAALQAAALRRTDPWIHQQQKKVAFAEKWLKHVWKIVQREMMQLQAHLDGNRGAEELQLDEVKNKDGVVVAHIDPDPDIDRLHIKVWSPDSEKYICFLDSKFTDTIAKLKKNPGASRCRAYDFQGYEGVLQWRRAG